MEAKAWGVSVIDVMSAMPFNCFSVPRRNLNIAKKLILPDEFSESGLSYEGLPYIFEVNNSRDPLGYMYKAAIYVIYKRGGYGDWAEFIELFGMPFRLAKYSAYDTNTRDELIKSLKMFGGAPYAVVPKEAEVDQKETSSSSNGQLYDRFLDRCDKEILITVLGQTMTTVDGSSKAQSQTHKEVEEDINKSDRKFVRRILNRNVLPILEAAGLPVAGGKFVFPEQGESLSTVERLDIAIKVKGEGIAVSDEYIYEVSGVRKPEKGETISSKAKAPNPDNPDPDDTDPKAPVKKTTLKDAIAGFFADALSSGRAPLKF
jgi:phage gp29-like protein